MNPSSEPQMDLSCPDNELGMGSELRKVVDIGGTLVEISLEVIGSLMIG